MMWLSYDITFTKIESFNSSENDVNINQSKWILGWWVGEQNKINGFTHQRGI